jgi:hypothetical protein
MTVEQATMLHATVQVSDVDGTMIDDNELSLRCAWDFREYWENTAALCSSILVYNTGRSIGQLTGLMDQRKDCMVVPDAIITAVGTKVFLLNRKFTRQTANRGAWCANVCACLYIKGMS